MPGCDHPADHSEGGPADVRLPGLPPQTRPVFVEEVCDRSTRFAVSVVIAPGVLDEVALLEHDPGSGQQFSKTLHCIQPVSAEVEYF